MERKEKLKTKWAQLEALVGAEKRLKLIAEDLVKHFEQRLETKDGTIEELKESETGLAIKRIRCFA